MSRRTARSLALVVFASALGCGDDVVGPGGDEVASETESGSSSDTGTETQTDTGTDTTDSGVEDSCPANAPGAEIVACTTYPARGFTSAQGWIYFSQSDGIERVRPDGSERELFIDGVGDVRQLQIVDDTLYWIEFNEGLVRARQLAGGAIEDLGEVLFKPSSFVVHDAQVYVSQYSVDLDILALPLAGGPSAVAQPMIDFAGDLAVVGSDLYWVSHTNDGNVINEITRAPLAGGPTQLISGTLHSTAGLVADATHLYWTRASANSTGGAYRWPLAGGEVETLAVFADNQVGQVALDADALYWTFVDTSTDNDGQSGQVWRVAKPGGNAELLIDGQSYTEGVLVDPTHVYWVNNLAIARLPLP